MNARKQILSKLRRQIVDQIALPEVLDGDWIEFEDPVQQFRQSIEMVGGSCFELDSLSSLPKSLQGYSEWQSAARIFSRIVEVPGNVDLAEVDNAHDLENLDFVVYPGQFAVAENGAIWLTDKDLKHRVIFFITQFLVLVVEKKSLIHNMHQAYARVKEAESIKKTEQGFGLFLSGPSKTADIEQSLVIGAHGCRELQVFLV